MLSFWVTFVALAVMIAALLRHWRRAARAVGPAYAPLSALGRSRRSRHGTGQTLWIISIAIFCVASLLTSLNFLTTTLNLRSPRHVADAHAAHRAGPGLRLRFWRCWRFRFFWRLAFCCCSTASAGRASSFPAAW